MWTRAELKKRAKSNLRRNYLSCILVGLVLLVAMGSQQTLTFQQTGSLPANLTQDQTILLQYQIMRERLTTFLLGPNQVLWNMIESWLGGTAGLVFLVLKIFVFNPLEVGGCSFFIENSEGMPGFEKILKAFQSESYKNVVFVLVVRDVTILLWTMLFIIPGIYKGYEYYMVPYLLSDDPSMSREDAFRISKEMMYGQKMDTLFLELSFILWEFVSALSFGLLGIFFLNPYRHGTLAELYLYTREHYFRLNHPGQTFQGSFEEER